MEIEEKQAEVIDHFVKQASAQKGSALGSVFVEATSHPSLFAFSEILAVPTVAELEGTDNSVHLEVLRLFAYGTWSDYKRKSGKLPQLVPDQVLKLKQLTVLTLAETKKVLSYDQLMLELDVTNVRELEDFLINDCMYAVRNMYLQLSELSFGGLVRGKLDQLRRYFEVQFAAGRDLRPGQLGSMIQTLSNCFWLCSLELASSTRLATSDNLLVTIQDKIKWADTMSELDKKHRKELEDRVMEVKKAVSVKVSMLVDEAYIVPEGTDCKQANTDFQGLDELNSEPGGMMDFEEDQSRHKRGFTVFTEKASDVLKIEHATYWTAFRRPARFLFTIVPVTNDSAFQAVIVLLCMTRPFLGPLRNSNHPEGGNRVEAALDLRHTTLEF
ncbi:COP9 signalosome complex subunit 7-like isoform X2 [Gossypium australe]|uniref:COP9 signalosome complex subunit 7-like isoform X2 n=1 Tax=Gossypium australe TaxID=47621 RepID=A0A5B6VQX5_9ROSI|nr:COP9 signalosome complex subunit 7-like isoform X2 [Gossypium australe]